MARYYVNMNAQPNGDHEVHRDGCDHPADVQNQYTLGDFSSCVPAVAKAKETYAKADGCAYCCAACHTS